MWLVISHCTVVYVLNSVPKHRSGYLECRAVLVETIALERVAVGLCSTATQDSLANYRRVSRYGCF